MNFGFVSDAVEDLRIINPAHPVDSAALLPFVGAPFAYHQFRQGRSTWGSTALSAGISVGVGEFAFWYAGRAAGFTSLEWFLGRGLHSLGVTHGGRSYLSSMILGSKNPAKGFGWRVPTWVYALGMYEYGMWFGDWASSAQPGSQQFWEEKYE